MSSELLLFVFGQAMKARTSAVTVETQLLSGRFTRELRLFNVSSLLLMFVKRDKIGNVYSLHKNEINNAVNEK